MVLLALAALSAVGAVPLLARPVSAAGPTALVLDGHGNGHGYGLSQWGAYGYAVDRGWSAEQILSHYFGGTVPATVPATAPPATSKDEDFKKSRRELLDAGRATVEATAAAARVFSCISCVPPSSSSPPPVPSSSPRHVLVEECCNLTWRREEAQNPTTPQQNRHGCRGLRRSRSPRPRS